MIFSERLKALRKEQGVSQDILGEKIGLTSKQIRRYEQNDSEPTLSKLIALADYFDISLDYLVGRSDVSERR